MAWMDACPRATASSSRGSHHGSRLNTTKRAGDFPEFRDDFNLLIQLRAI
jgi:hypothetical protein